MKSTYGKIFKDENGVEFGLIREAKHPYPNVLSGTNILAEDECETNGVKSWLRLGNVANSSGWKSRQLKCLQVDGLLSQFGSDREQAIIRYQNFVRAGIGLSAVWEKLKNQIFLGEIKFVERLQSQIKAKSGDLKEIPKAQRRAIGRPLSYYKEAFPNTKDGMRKAYKTGDYTLQQIAKAFGVHYSTVSRAVKKI